VWELLSLVEDESYSEPKEFEANEVEELEVKRKFLA
jgi:hypothetical protein